MPEQSQQKIALWISVMAIGTSLNTIGIVLVRAGAIRYVLMGAGVLMLLIALIGLINSFKK